MQSLHSRPSASVCQHGTPRLGHARAAATRCWPVPSGRCSRLSVAASGGGGFGKSSKPAAPSGNQGAGKKQAAGTKPRPAAAPLPVKPASGAAAGSTLRSTATAADLAKGSWIEVLDDVQGFFDAAGKDIKAVTLAAGRTLALYRLGGVVYCSDVNSTAYQFPLIDAKVLPGQGLRGGPAVEVPLDGTQYDLATGKVLKWCPKSDNLVQNVFATLKRTTNPVDLPVFPTHVTPDGKLRVRLVRD